MRKAMRALKTSRHTALGVLHDYLTWINMHCESGQIGLTPAELDDELGFRGAGEALCSIGWCSVGGDGLMVAADWEQHNGQSAKVRAQAASRQARYKKSNAPSVTKGDAPSVTKVTQEVTQEVTQGALAEKRRVYSNNKERGSTTVEYGAAVEPPPALPSLSEEFREWLAALCGCVPQLAAFRTLPGDVLEAALEAYGCLPQAAEYAPLLMAYYADRMQQDRYRQPFWRPMGAQFFRELGDVIFKHAVRWQRETKWKPGAERKVRQKVGAAPPQEPGMSDDEKAAAMARMRAELRRGEALQ